MIFIVRYTHKDQISRHYSYPVLIGGFASVWKAKRRFGIWRFDVYIGTLKCMKDTIKSKGGETK